MEGYIGCYSSNESKNNCVRFCFDETMNWFSDKPTCYPIQDAKYLALDGNYLYTIAYDNGYGFYRINVKDGTKVGQFVEPSLAFALALIQVISILQIIMMRVFMFMINNHYN